MEYRTPSEVVGAQVREQRRKRNWSQEQLAARLAELGLPGWRQSKIAKVERGQVKRLPLEDVFALALALDVAPLYLLAPSSVWNKTGSKPLKIGFDLAGKLLFWPKPVQEWVAGDKPLLSRVDYKTAEEAKAAGRHYFFESRPFGEWNADELVRRQQE